MRTFAKSAAESVYCAHGVSTRASTIAKTRSHMRMREKGRTDPRPVLDKALISPRKSQPRSARVCAGDYKSRSGGFSHDRDHDRRARSRTVTSA